MKYVVAMLMLALASVPAYAHHGWGSYEPSRAMTLDGTIQKASLSNPHSTMTVSHSAGTLNVVLAPLSRMTARGATRELVAPGKRVKSLAFPHRSRPGEVRAEWIEIDGKRIAMRK